MHEQSDGRRWSGGGHQQGQCQSSTPSKSQRPGSSPPLSHPFLTVYPHTDVPNKRILCFLPSNKKQERERRGERGGLKDRGSVLEHRGTALDAANSCSRVHRLGWAQPCSIQKGTNAPDNVPTAQAEEPSARPPAASPPNSPFTRSPQTSSPRIHMRGKVARAPP